MLLLMVFTPSMSVPGKLGKGMCFQHHLQVGRQGDFKSLLRD